jgi:curved DNA-binding protein CbpA
MDSSLLERNYKQLQRLLHPDKFATASPQQRAFSDQQASAVNEAYDTLKRPLKRAQYIVSRAFGQDGEGTRVAGRHAIAWLARLNILMNASLPSSARTRAATSAPRSSQSPSPTPPTPVARASGQGPARGRDHP